MTRKPISRAERAVLFAPFEEESHIGLAVSGGLDSLALMHLAKRWCDERGENAPRLSVLTVDHGLREGSAGEARRVHDSARALGLEGHILRWQPGPKRTRIQADARQARYDLMAACAHENGIGALATAHHIDDQAETLLMRLGRGSGIGGLAGIPARGEWAGIAVLRPLLDVPKSRLDATLWEEGVRWIDDPSNQDERFERVRVRKAMNQLEALGIGSDALALSAKRLRRANEALEARAGEFLAQHALIDEAGYCRMEATSILAVPDEIALRGLARALQGVGGSVSAPRLAKLEKLLDALRDSIAHSQTLGGCRVTLSGDDILIVREAGRAGLGEMTLRPGESQLWDNRYRVTLDRACTGPVLVRALGPRGFGAVRARLGRAVSLPDHAADGLVSFWRKDEVFSVPPLGFSAPGSGNDVCAAQFVNRNLFTTAR